MSVIIKTTLIITIIASTSHVSQSAKILGFFPVPSISHQVVFRALMEELANRGHQITMVTTDPIEKPHSNITQIDLHDLSYDIMKRAYDRSFNFKLSAFYKVFIDTFDAELASPKVGELLNDTKAQFDLCFVECIGVPMYPIKDRFKCPLILMCSLSPSFYNWEALGNPTNPAFYPGPLAKDFGQLNFVERVEATTYDLYFRFTVNMYIMKEYNSIAKKYFGSETRDVQTIMEDVDMLFVNSHPVLGSIRPTVPAVVYMGSMHIKKPKPLPQNLQEILDSSTNGVIYFSLGSNVHSKKMSPEKRQVFLDTFSEIPFTVIWKWENDSLDGKSNNVHTFKWLPQQDLLAHPNVKLFITQGGQQSLEESIHHKVPLIAIPVFADQHQNAQRIVKFEIGHKIDINTISTDLLKKTIFEITNNIKYKENIINLNKLIYDQPQTSLERTVWWTEYVLRHKGAKQLRSPAVGLPFYVYYLMDVIAFYLVIMVTLVYTIYKGLAVLVRIIRKSKVKKE